MQASFDAETIPDDPAAFLDWLEQHLNQLTAHLPPVGEIIVINTGITVDSISEADAIRAIAGQTIFVKLQEHQSRPLFGEDFLPPDPADPMDRLCRQRPRVETYLLESSRRAEPQDAIRLPSRRIVEEEKPWHQHRRQSRRSQLRATNHKGHKGRR